MALHNRPLIKSLRRADAQALFERQATARFVNGRSVAERKPQTLDLATRLDDLRIPPNNRLEALKRDRKTQHSIRINDQWRLCFVWTGSDAEAVKTVDHR